MITNKAFGIREVMVAMLLLAGLLFSAGVAFAQTSTFTPPSGYNQVGNTGVYYNSTSGMYYNPMTGQYTSLRPLGEASRDASGNYVVGSGYTPLSGTSYYYNSSTGYYYDPATGFYSTTAPTNTGVTAQMAQNYTPPTSGNGGNGGTFTPGVPNTGAGGNAATTFAILALLGAAAVTGAITLSRRVA